MNNDADASAEFELDADPLAAGLDGVAAKFEALSSQINASFAAANQQIANTATATGALATGAPAATGLSRGLMLAAQAAQFVAISVAGIITTLARLVPFVQFIPNALGSWVPAVKGVVGQYEKLIATVNILAASVRAVQGRLTLLSAVMTGFSAASAGVFTGLATRIAGIINAHTRLGVSVKTVERSLVVMGTAGAFAFSRMVNTARGVVGLIGNMGSAVGSAVRNIGGIGGSFRNSAASAAMILSPVAGLALALGPIGTAALGVAGAFGVVKKSVASAAEVQTLQTSFVTLLGGVDAAQKRMAELSRFAATTPFDIPGVVKASKVLETLTGGALSTGAGLRLVGDAAAVSQQPFEELAVHIGRLYDGLKNGRPVGEAMARLQELGLISSNTRARIEAMQASGQKGDAVWSLAAASLGRFSGEMKRQSGTWNGMLSNLSDTIGGLFRELGAPIITNLSPFLDKLITYLGSFSGWAAKTGEIFAGWSALIAQIFVDGKISEALALAGRVGFIEATNALLGGLTGAGAALTEILGGAVRAFLSMLQFATKAEFWSGLAYALASAGSALIALINEGVAKLLDMVADLPGVGDYARQGAASLRQDSEAFTNNASMFAGMAGSDLAPLFASWGDEFGNTMDKAVEAFVNGREMGGSLLDSDAARADLSAFLKTTAGHAQSTIDAAAASAAAGGLPAPLGKPDDPLDASGKKGRAGSDVASLQRIGGGGGFSISKADPLLTETRSQTGEIRGMRSDIKALKDALTSKRPTVSEAVFG